MVSRLITTLSGPLFEFEQRVLDATPAIKRWFCLEWQEHAPPLYCSADLRNAGFKPVPVDTNLFPGGFNNLAPEMLPLAMQAAMTAIEKIYPDVKNLLLIPERHTRSMFYLQNVACLSQIVRQAGLNVRLDSPSEDITEPASIGLPDGQHLMIEPVRRIGTRGRRLGMENFDPCPILLNNDLSVGIPPTLENISEQYLLPPLHAGWSRCRKANHFAAYDEVAKKFAKLIDIDPWTVGPYFTRCSGLGFHERAGEEELVHAVETVLKRTTKKYKEYDVTETPYMAVKTDTGTYGMGVATVYDPSEVRDLNRKECNKMGVVKEGLEVSEVIVQEDVHTFGKINKAVTEPVVYMVDCYAVGGFYRVHTGHGVDENLNAPGMHFMPLPSASSSLPDNHAKPGAGGPNHFYTYSVVARLALLTAPPELEKTDPNPLI